MTAASSPTLGPTTTRGSRTGCLSKIACSVSARSLPIGRNCIAPSSIHRMPGAAAAGPASPVVECVPNVSEGRDRALIETLAAAIRAVPGVTLANVHADPDHHRSVVSFLGGPEAVEAAALALAARVVALLDMRQHRGIHPRVGALDVLPFVPLVGFTMDQTVALARRVGRAIGARHSLPVYYYGGGPPAREPRDRAGLHDPPRPPTDADPGRLRPRRGRGTPSPHGRGPERARRVGTARGLRRAHAGERRARELHVRALPRDLPRAGCARVRLSGPVEHEPRPSFGADDPSRGAHLARPVPRYFSGSLSNFCLQPTAQK